IVPLQRFLAARLHGRLRTLVPLLGFLLIVSLLRSVMPSVSPVARLILLAENVVAAAWILWALARLEGEPSPMEGLSGRFIVQVGRAMLIGLAVSILANLFGTVSLAAVLSRAVLGS